MKITAKLSQLRIAPRKVRLVVDLIRGKKALQAQALLQFATKKAAGPVLKLLNSALANAKNNFQVEPGELTVSEIRVNEGPKFKRWMPRARGSAFEILKRTSHIELTLEGGSAKAKKVKKAKQAPEEAKPVEAAPEKAAKPEEKPKFKAEAKEIPKPQTHQGLKRIFKRKSF